MAYDLPHHARRAPVDDPERALVDVDSGVHGDCAWCGKVIPAGCGSAWWDTEWCQAQWDDATRPKPRSKWRRTGGAAWGMTRCRQETEHLIRLRVVCHVTEATGDTAVARDAVSLARYDVIEDVYQRIERQLRAAARQRGIDPHGAPGDSLVGTSVLFVAGPYHGRLLPVQAHRNGQLPSYWTVPEPARPPYVDQVTDSPSSDAMPETPREVTYQLRWYRRTTVNLRSDLTAAYALGPMTDPELYDALDRVER